MDPTSSPPQLCPFCLQNNILTPDQILAQSDNAFTITPRGAEGNYLIIPKAHAESPLELADNWWQDVKQLLLQVPDLHVPYNLSFNIGKVAGQSVSHLHLWVIPRSEGQPASGKGFARLIAEVNQQANT
jgi:histidine triad (HIT) family protein